MADGHDVVVFGAEDATSAAQWRTHAAPGSSVTVASEADGTLRLDVALAGHGAFAIVRRELDFTLPAHYAARLVVGGDGGPFELQLKLVDPSGANVWWWRRSGFRPPKEFEGLVLHRAALAFAWGPKSGAEPDRVAAVELAVASDAPVRATLRVQALRIEAREPESAVARVRSVRASSAAPGHEAEQALARGRGWQPASGDPAPWLELDLGRVSELGGVLLDGGDAGATPACRLLGKGGAAPWTPWLAVEPAPGARRWLETGPREAEHLRLELDRSAAPSPLRVDLVPLDRALSPLRFATVRARRAPRGRHPRHLLGEHADWALVAGERDEEKALLGADGALESGVEGFTLEPFLGIDGRFVGWADVEATPALLDGSLPIPSVTWQSAALRLEVTAFASGPPGESALVARYRLENGDTRVCRVRLLLAIRPYQVTPAWQALGLAPGVAPIHALAHEGGCVRVNDQREVVAVTAPDGFCAVASHEGLDAVLYGAWPRVERLADPLGFAEGVLRYDLELAAGEDETIWLALPLHAATARPPAAVPRAEAQAWGEGRLEATRAEWRERLAALPLELPRVAARFDATARASLAWILANRAGPRLLAGPRCYRRAWIRDGVLSGAALAEWGFHDALAHFLRWYAPHQLADGRVPCAIGPQGRDLAVEHDSHGELVWGVVEAWRLTGETEALRALWPHVVRAVDAIAALRAERTSEAYRGDPRYGLLPESISHEGYSAQPVHSYWDDFFALRALGDARDAARALADRGTERLAGRLHDAMRRDLHASLAAARASHGIDFLPGSVELGDLDPSSTAIAFDPCGEDPFLDPAACEATFERFWSEFEARRRGERVPDATTPYEMRVAVALLRLGRPDRALALLEAWLDAQRPPAWRQWPEVVTRDPRTPRFLGDLPHSWAAAGFLRALRRLVVDERDAEGVLVIGSGVPEAWLRSGEGVRAHGLPTHFGALDLWIRIDAEVMRVSLGGSCRPPGGWEIVSPFGTSPVQARVDGEVLALEVGRVRLRGRPREVELSMLASGRPRD